MGKNKKTKMDVFGSMDSVYINDIRVDSKNINSFNLIDDGRIGIICSVD